MAAPVLRGVVRLLRPKQWVKNVLVFAAPLFAGPRAEGGRWAWAVLAFAAMSLVSSSTYVFNDLVDADRDRRHPQKRLRPLASGVVSRPLGLAVGASLLMASLALASVVNVRVALCVLSYVAMQVAYNAWLKRVELADVYTIAAGFVLRAILGAVAVGVGISGWLLFCTGSLALMLGFAKRRHEFILQGDDRAGSRESLVRYTRAALDALVVMFATGAALSYGIYCLESRTGQRYPALILTAPFVFYGVSRYVLIVFSLDEGGEPADLLVRDRHIVVSLALFVAFAALALGGLRVPVVER